MSISCGIGPVGSQANVEGEPELPTWPSTLDAVPQLLDSRAEVLAHKSADVVSNCGCFKAVTPTSHKIAKWRSRAN